MRALRPEAVTLSVAALAAAAAGALVVASSRETGAAGRSAQFQALVGGLGVGAALDLSGCAAAYDPRLGRGCADTTGPLPGGARFCESLGGDDAGAAR